MARLEQIIAKILSVRPDLSREDIMRMVEEKERLARGFLTKESAALALAAEMGIHVEPETRYELRIKDLVSGLRDVTVTGRAIYVSQPKKFSRPDGGEGIKRILHIADNTGVIRVILWGDMAVSMRPESIIDRIVRISHLSVRRRAGGGLELRASSRSTIEINPADTRPEDYPPITLFMKSIGELPQHRDKIVSVLGLIEHVYPVTTFKREGGAEGRVRRAELLDGAGRAMLVLWNEHADNLQENHAGKYVLAFGVRVKERFDGRLELHSRSGTQIVVTERRPSGFRG